MRLADGDALTDEEGPGAHCRSGTVAGAGLDALRWSASAAGVR